MQRSSALIADAVSLNAVTAESAGRNLAAYRLGECLVLGSQWLRMTRSVLHYT